MFGSTLSPFSRIRLLSYPKHNSERQFNAFAIHTKVCLTQERSWCKQQQGGEFVCSDWYERLQGSVLSASRNRVQATHTGEGDSEFITVGSNGITIHR